MEKLVIAGWKDVSLIDVVGKATFTLWLCGCNLRCPFCHNHRLANSDPQVCRVVDTEEILKAIRVASRFVDALHVTGGEPLTQLRSLKKFLKEVKESVPELPISINTNCTLTNGLEELLKAGLVNHVATDIKYPFKELSGLQEKVAKELWSKFKESLKLLSNYGVEVELRVPVTKGLVSPKELASTIYEVINEVGLSKYYVVVNPLLGPPVTTPRDLEWCRRYCNPRQDEVDEVAKELRGKGVRVVKVQSVPPYPGSQ